MKKNDLKDFKNDFEKLNENNLSFSDIKDKIDYSKVSSSKRQLISPNVFRLVIAMLIITVFVIPIVLYNSKTSDKPNPPKTDDSDNNPTVGDKDNDPIKLNYDLNYAIYTGAKKVLGETNTKLNTHINASSTTIKTSSNDPIIAKLNDPIIKYPFASIQIENPLAFNIQRTDTSSYNFLESKVGYGQIEVIIANITFYNEDGYQEYPVETIVIFACSEGVYSCLTNGLSHEYNSYGKRLSSTYTFSSHKYVDGLEIVKTDKMNNIVVAITSDNVVSDLTISDYESNEVSATYSYIDNSLREITATELFAYDALVTYTLKEIELTIVDIKSIGNDIYLTVDRVEGYRVNEVLLNSSTEFKDDFNYKSGDTVIITYAAYYDLYNPKQIQALQIRIKENQTY